MSSHCSSIIHRNRGRQTCRVIRFPTKAETNCNYARKREIHIGGVYAIKNFEFTPQEVRFCNLSSLWKERSGIRSKLGIVKKEKMSI